MTSEESCDQLAERSRPAKFFYYKRPCYYEANGVRISDKAGLQEQMESHIAHPIHLVVFSWSDLDEMNTGSDTVNWRWITDVIILNEENKTADKFLNSIAGNVYLPPTKSKLIILLDPLIREAFNKELEWCKINDSSMISDVTKRWDDFEAYVEANPTSPAITSNEAGTSSNYWSIC